MLHVNHGTFVFIANSAGEPLSTLDGVPIAVKDEIDCLPYPTTGKSRFISQSIVFFYEK